MDEHRPNHGARGDSVTDLCFDKDEVGPWVCSKFGSVFTKQDTEAIGLKKSGHLIAGVLYDNYNFRSIAMHVAGEGNWLNREYLWLCFHYPFVQLGVNKVIGFVSSANEKALNFDLRLGFKHESTIKDAAKDGDILILTMTKEQCPWLALGDKYGFVQRFRPRRA